MQAEWPKNVFLDTCVFDGVKLEFDHPQLTRLVGLVQDGLVAIYLPAVTVREVEAHIDEKAMELAQGLTKFQRNAPALRGLGKAPYEALFVKLSPEEIRSELRAKWDGFLKTANVTVLPVDGITAESLLEAYFKKQPPFGVGKKKSEFPDAIAAEAILRARGTAWHKAMVVVSGDHGWRDVCEARDELIHMSRLAELIEMFPGEELTAGLKAAFQTTQNLAHFESSIAELVDGVGVFVEDAGGEVEEIRVGDLEYDGVYVLSASDGEAVLEVDCEVFLEADATFHVPGTGIYDSEEGKLYWVEQKKATAEKPVRLTVQVTMEYAEDQPEEAKIVATEFVREPWLAISLDDVGELPF